MEDKLAVAISQASHKVLVAIVKLSQKQERKGSKGGWKAFLNSHDRKLGSCVSDPAMRPSETLLAFLCSFTSPDDLKFIEGAFRTHYNWEVLESSMVTGSPENESPERRLVRETVEHPCYLSKFTLPSHEKDWVITKIGKKKKLLDSNDMLAVDCEMVLCEDNTDALVRVCVVDQKLQIKLDEHVNPGKPISDYRTEITGISAKDLESVSCTLADVQKSLKKLLSKSTILVGHSIYNDMLALKLNHARVIDTSFIFKTADGKFPSLNNLCKSVLGYELHKKETPHNCLEDARATMKLVLAKIELGVDKDIPLIQRDIKEVSPSELEKLLIHRIPLEVPIQELRGIFLSNFAVELKLLKRARGKQYTALATFENPQEAHRAFTNANGTIEKDQNGFPQKLVKFNCRVGPVCVYVRKMALESGLQPFEQKRPRQGEDSRDPKKHKSDRVDDHAEKIERPKMDLKEMDSDKCSDHLQEIERLKQDLKSKDVQLSVQDKMITKLRKQLGDLKKKKRKR